MSEQLFRYVRRERAVAFETVGWSVLSGPLKLKPPPELEGSPRAVAVVKMGWARAGHPVEPKSSAEMPDVPLRKHQLDALHRGREELMEQIRTSHQTIARSQELIKRIDAPLSHANTKVRKDD